MAFTLAEGGWPAPPGKPDDHEFSDEQIRLAWRAHGPKVASLQRGGKTACWAYWYVDPDVPDSLRPARPIYVDVDDATTKRRLDVERADLIDRQRLWLRERFAQPANRG